MTTVDVNRKSQTITTVMNDLNFTLESITRTVKTATKISTDDNLYRFKDQRADVTNYVTYRHDDEKDIIEKCESSNEDIEDCVEYFPIVSDQIKIERFLLRDINTEDNGQPRFLLVVDGYAEITSRIKSEFSIQTTISPRTVNFNGALGLYD